jgi:uncharacterized membrane protein YfcA
MDFSLISVGLLLAVLIAVAIGSLAKGITGIGLPILAVPALASFTSVEEAVVLMVLPSVAANSWLVATHRKWSILPRHCSFLVLGLVGCALGTWLLSIVDDHWLKLILAIWLGIYLLQHFSKRSYDRYFSGHGHASGSLLGFAAGTIQGASGISSPIVAPYFHANGLVSETYAFATAFTFLLFSGVQVVAMSKLDLLTPERLIIGLVVVVPTLLFTQLGIRLSRSVSEKAFHNILITLFVAMEIKLIIDIARSTAA